MIKNKQFKNGKKEFKSYLKPYGRTYEVGFLIQNKPLFVGSFCFSKDAQKWYSTMNQEIQKFSKSNKVGASCPGAWYHHYLSNHIYTKYYNFLDKIASKRKTNCKKQLVSQKRKYLKLKKKWVGKPIHPALKAA